MNLKLLAAKMRRRLSLTDSLAELLVLTDLEIEMVEREKKRKRKRKPSARQEWDGFAREPGLLDVWASLASWTWMPE